MDQPTLTEFYSTKKRPIEGINPAKRRKLIDTEAVGVSEVQNTRESARITRQRTKTNAPKPTRVLRTRKSRTKNVAKTTESSNMQAFLSLGIKEVTEETERVISEVTSTEDDHEVERIMSSKETPSLERASTRRRKLQPKQVGNKRETQESDAEIIENTKEKTASRARRGKRSQKKEIPKVSDEVEKLQESVSVEKNDNKETTEDAKDESVSAPNKTQTKAKQSVMVPEKSPIKTASSKSGGLKINPWIAEQANRVLLSRGQAALLLSQQKNVDTKQSRPRSKEKKPVAEKSGLTKTKAQEGLEKARELIKKMRTLEADSSKSKESSTADTSERLHKLAKRQAAEGVSDVR